MLPKASVKIRIALALILVSLPSVAMADTFRGRIPAYPLGSVLTAVDLSGAVGTRTSTLDLTGAKSGYAKLVTVVHYTFGAATALTVTASCSLDNGATYGQETSTSISSGTGTVSKYTDSYTTSSASADLHLTYGISACDHYKLIFAATGPNSSDLLTVQASLATD